VTAEERAGRSRNKGDSELDSEDAEEQMRMAARLREAREYIGLLQEDVASALGIPRASVSAFESGKRRVTGLELRRLARLYRRQVGWLLGEEEVELSNAEPLFRATESLSEQDKEQVLRFAEFLAAAGKPGSDNEAAARSRRRRGSAQESPGDS
jgi:transcriptional regulator with XRE-family HTH domain